jgi:hypothetical protein
VRRARDAPPPGVDRHLDRADISAVFKELGLTTIKVTTDMYGHLSEKASKRMATNAASPVPRAGKAT